MYEQHVRVVCTRAHMGVEEGEFGTIVFGADYLPGWDAGCWTVEPDSFPERSPYGHRAVNYWTREEMFESWKEVLH